jgi:hypothetical protein
VPLLEIDMPQLIATRRLTYGTRRLQADDQFTASKQDAKVLIALQRARPAPAAEPVQPVPPAPVEASGSEDAPLPVEAGQADAGATPPESSSTAEGVVSQPATEEAARPAPAAEPVQRARKARK